MSDPLENLAQRGRTRRTEQLRAEQREAMARRKAREADARKIQRRTFMPVLDQVLGTVAWMATLGASIGGAVWQLPMVGPVPFISLFASVGLAIVVMVLFEKKVGELRLQRGIAWLRQLPFDFDDQTYLDSLGVQTSTARVQLELRFAQPLAEAERERVESALAGAADLGDADWEDTLLTVESPLFEVVNRGHGRSYSHRKGHLWFKAVAERSLPAIHGRHPIETVRCRMSC